MTGIELIRVSKTFGGRRALSDASLCWLSDGVLGIVGENGAGKSTLGWLLAGRFSDYVGDVLIDGRITRLNSRAAALKAGIWLVPQEPALAPNLTVLDELTLSMVGSRPQMWLDSRSSVEGQVRATLSLLNVDVDLHQRIEALSAEQRRQIALACALARRPKYLIVDEPFEAASQSSARTFDLLLENLSGRGTSVLLISHSLEATTRLARRVSVLRDGAVVATRESHAWTVAELKSEMTGEVWAGAVNHVEELSPVDETPAGDTLSLEITFGGTRARAELRKGEITALVRRSGASASPVLRSLVGLAEDDVVHAAVEVNHRRRTWATPRQARQMGTLYLSCDRDTEGGFQQLTVLDNLTIDVIADIAPFGLLSDKRRRILAVRVADAVGFDALRLDEPFQALSGGNQQRVLIGRMIAAKPSLALIDEPNRGVDSPSRPRLIQAIKEMCLTGGVVVVASSDDAFLMSVADRFVFLEW